jgi:hypothetical protein
MHTTDTKDSILSDPRRWRVGLNRRRQFRRNHGVRAPAGIYLARQ